jgi:hypothetical protein
MVTVSTAMATKLTDTLTATIKPFIAGSVPTRAHGGYRNQLEYIHHGNPRTSSTDRDHR